MEESVRLLEQGGFEAGTGSVTGPMGQQGPARSGRRGRLWVLAALLLLPSVYLLSRPPLLPRPLAPDRLGASDERPQFIESIPPGYLVWSPSCRIPDLNPFEKSAMKIFHRRKYIPCTNEQTFTYVAEDINGNGVLYINKTLFYKHKKTLTCCYYNVTRSKDPKKAESKIESSACTPFNNSVVLKDSEEFIITKCQIKYSKKVYENAHSNIQYTNDIKARLVLNDQKYNKTAWNVLMIGIDTLSRINLARAMPNTNKFLKENNWLDFQGYNKMDDNTFPNLMAILTGRNQSRARYTCDRSGVNSPDNCDYMWKQYKNVGYVTAYAEDYIGIDTFGKSLHTGFTKPPTDHYLRPLYMAIEKQVHKLNGDNVHCAGQVTSGELLYNYALNFVVKYKNDPFFGFFWTNTFSHDDVETPSTMDDKTHDFFKSLKLTGTLNKTIIWFISDHGIRFGKLRSTLDGYYEERLPTMMIWVPPLFIKENPEAYNALKVNMKRLTTPYDLHMTLQDILYISGRKKELVPSEGCPKCQSLFQQVPWNRSCESSSLSPHWCTCNLLKPLPINHDIANLAIHFVINVEIERILDAVNKKDHRICAKLSLSKVLHVYLYDNLQKSIETTDYLIVFSTKPGNMEFESTVRFNNTNEKFEILGIVSRLTAYKGKGGCVKTAHLKKYCICT